MPAAHRCHAALLVTLVTFCSSQPLPAMHAEFKDAAGNYAYSEEFLTDYQDALSEVERSGSAAPLHALLSKYESPNEQAELQLTLGVIYAQRTGFVSPEKAVEHLTRALHYELPTKAHLDTLLWRASAYEQLKQRDAAIGDHLRGLAACATFGTIKERPELLPPAVEFSINPQTPEERQIKEDYRRYRAAVMLRQHVHKQRGYFITGLRRLTRDDETSADKLHAMLERITPDPQTQHTILKAVTERD